jgi:catechol 2,3-dioxygenase-like lactoylglutathione lyase family enzyme
MRPTREASGKRRGPATRVVAAAIALVFGLAGLTLRASGDYAPLQAVAVDSVGMTIADMDRALAFYTGALPFVKIADQEFSGRPYELLSGVFGARTRVARLRLGLEEIELTEFLAPKGRPVPADMHPNDRAFQHIALVVGDINKAYAGLRDHGVEHASTGPQRLPDWNPNAGGINAFYFRDPDRHFLEIISFPGGKGQDRWHQDRTPASLFLGIDHTAIVVSDTSEALRFYRDTLGMRVAGESENYDVEQEHLNNVFGARLRITALRATTGPGIELLEYLAPRDGRPAPADLRANDVAHWQTTIVTKSLEQLIGSARDHRVALVSPGAVDFTDANAAFRIGALTRDPDGHGMRLVVR